MLVAICAGKIIFDDSWSRDVHDLAYDEEENGVRVIFGGQLLDIMMNNEISSKSIIGWIWSYVAPFRMYWIEYSSLNNGKVLIIFPRYT